MDDCIFCKIIEGSIPGAMILDEDNIVAILDIGPLNKGHALVISKEHHETIKDVPDEILKDMIVGAKKVANALSSALNTNGCNILMNNKKVAGQIVPHAHIHIIPRFEGDGINWEWNTKRYDDKEIEEYKAKIAKFL